MTKDFRDLIRSRAVSTLGLDPFPWYQQMRLTDPVHLEEENNLCELFRYKDIQYVLAHPALFSSERNSIKAGKLRGMVIYTDPPRHGKLRSLISWAFTPRASAQQAQQIRSIVNTLLDRSSAEGEMDIITDLSFPLPVMVIADMLGIPPEDRDKLKDCAGMVMGLSKEQAARVMKSLEDYFRSMLARKRQQRQQDLPSALLAAQLDGERLSRRRDCRFLYIISHSRHPIANKLDR